MIIKYTPFLFLLFLFEGSSFGQTLEEFVMNDVYFDSAQLVKQNVRSVHAYIELVSQSRNDSPEFHASKYLDMEWNTNGQVTYKRFLSKSSKGGDLGANKTFYRKFEYDGNHRLINECNSTGKDSNCVVWKYNDEGKIISKIDTYGGYETNTYEYTWKNGEVIDVKFAEKSEWNDRGNPEIKFDKTGHITEYKFDKTRYVKVISKNGNIKSTDWKHIRNDTVIRHNTFSLSIDKNQVLSNCQMNIDGDTIKLIKATYDNVGNITFLSIKDWETAYDDIEDSEFEQHNAKTYTEERTYEFENFYFNGLLNKRIVTEHMNHFSGKGRKAVQRFLYESDELDYKYWPQKRKVKRDEDQLMEMIEDTEIDIIAPEAPAVKPIPEVEMEEIDDNRRRKE